MAKWTEQDDKTLRNLWGGRYSAREIGHQLKRTKSAILGRVWRIGLSDPVRALAQQKKSGARVVRRSHRNKPVVKVSKPIVQANIATPEPKNISLMDLLQDDCRWPVNAPERGEEHLFCGNQKHENSSYCEAHYKASIRADRWQQ